MPIKKVIYDSKIKRHVATFWGFKRKLFHFDNFPAFSSTSQIKIFLQHKISKPIIFHWLLNFYTLFIWKIYNRFSHCWVYAREYMILWINEWKLVSHISLADFDSAKSSWRNFYLLESSIKIKKKKLFVLELSTKKQKKKN